MTKSKIFILISLSFAAGVLITSTFNIPNNYLIIIFLVGVLVCILNLINKLFILPVLFLLPVCCLGALRMNQTKDISEYLGLLGKKQELEGYIVEDIDTRTDKQLVTFLPTNYNQKILITSQLSQKLFYGDKVLVYGKLTEAKSDGDFDYKSYLQRFNVYVLESYPKILVLSGNKKNKIIYQILRLKYIFIKRLSKFYLEPQKSLLLGILIGAKKTLPQSIVDNFNLTGTSHIIAVSGYNISIIIGNLGMLAYIFGRKKIFWVIGVIIVSFVVIAGLSASVIRAATMGGLFLISRSVGRQYHIRASLFFAALIMLIINPRILVYDVGFQLSFAATAGIIYFMPHLEKLTISWNNYFGLKNNLLVTMSAIVSTLPLIVYNFNTLSLISPVVNLLILPLVPLVMLFGFLSILPVAGAGFAAITNVLLDLIIYVTKVAASVPYASVNMQIPNWFFMAELLCIFLLYYLIKQISSKFT